jgi:TRAP-type C4-dicarboxylate transport system permease small subunit
MQETAKALSMIDKFLTRALDVVVGFFFALIFGITVAQVFLRYGLNKGILGASELTEFLFICTTALGAAIGIRRRQHINISLVTDILPPMLRNLLDTAGSLLVAFLNGVLIWQSIAWIRHVGSNESPVLRIPEWLIQMSIPIGCGFVVLYCLYNSLMTLFADENPQDKREGR